MRCNFGILILSVISGICFGQETDTIPIRDSTIVEYDTIYLYSDTIRKSKTLIIQQEAHHDTIYQEVDVKQSLSISFCFSPFNLKSDNFLQPGHEVSYSECPSYRTGIQIYYVKNSLMLQTGFLLNYFSNNSLEQFTFMDDGNNINPDPGSNLQTKYIAEFHNRFYYADIPLMMGYSHDWKYFSFHFSAGPSLFLLLSTSAQVFDTENQSIETLKRSEMIRINSFFHTEIGADYTFYNNWSIAAGACFRKMMVKDRYLSDRNSQGYLIYYVGIRKKFNL